LSYSPKSESRILYFFSNEQVIFYNATQSGARQLPCLPAGRATAPNSRCRILHFL